MNLSNENSFFPDSFLWGVATSAFQLEGSPYADWAAWDSVLDSCPDVTRHYDLYKEDLKLLNELGVNAYRFSIEWSRIQPEEDCWDEEAIAHYQDIVNILIKNKIEPLMTIHHFTHPLWFLKKYPWHTKKSVEIFLGFTEKLLSYIKGVKYWITFNEPYVLLLGGYLEGCMPPGIKDMKLATSALENILVSHAGAYNIIHSRVPDAMVSVAHNMAAIAPWRRWNPADRLIAKIAKYFYNHSLLDAFKTGRMILKFPFHRPIELELPIKDKLDFFGINYYTRVHMRFNPFKKMGVEFRHRDIGGHGLTDMGWEIHPHGLEKVLRYASKLNVPLIITENGIATRSAEKKIKFMKRHVDVIEKCLRDKMDVRGYFYWSLIDNYEWLQGLDACFGLYRVDFETLKRRATNAAAYYSYIIRKNQSLS